MKGYSIFHRKRPEAGTENPAAQRFLVSMIFLNFSIDIFPVPRSINVPTMALTMLRKNLSALIVNTIPLNGSVVERMESGSSTLFHSAEKTLQIFVFASEWSLANEVKSEISNRREAPSFIFSRSNFLCENRENG